MQVGDEKGGERCPKGHPLRVISDGVAQIAQGSGETLARQGAICEDCGKRYERESSAGPWVMEGP
jgi:hypothetical protein